MRCRAWDGSAVISPHNFLIANKEFFVWSLCNIPQLTYIFRNWGCTWDWTSAPQHRRKFLERLMRLMLWYLLRYVSLSLPLTLCYDKSDWHHIKASILGRIITPPGRLATGILYCHRQTVFLRSSHQSIH